MLFFSEFVSLPFDWNLLLYGAGLAGAAGAASVLAHESPADYEGLENIDLDNLKNRVTELESVPARTLEQNDELAALYAVWAAVLCAEEADMNEVSTLYGKAEEVLQATLAQGDDAEIRRQLGGVYLAWAVAFNDYGDLETSVDYYQKGIDTLKPLDDAGDGEAKYETAGIKLNLGMVYRELGEFKKAKATFEESFLAYRAVEKIGVLYDTRFYMAKVSVQQGNLLYEMGEAVGAIVDAYNRAMRLYVEVIEDEGRTELERDLANVLMDRCMVTFEDCLSQKFESDEERNNVIDDIALDISRGLELLEKQIQEGDEAVRYDLFHGVTLQGKVLCAAGKYDEAKQFLDRALTEFADLGEGGDEEDDDVFLMQTAEAYCDRAVVHLGLGDNDQSKRDCQKGSELVGKLIQLESDDEAILELKERFQILLEQLG